MAVQRAGQDPGPGSQQTKNGIGLHCMKCHSELVIFKTRWGFIVLCPKCDNPRLRP